MTRGIAAASLSFVLWYFAGAVACAEPVTTLADIDVWIGQGQNESALVIDFNNGQDPLVWGYRYDGAASAEDMFRAVVTGDSRLYAKIDTPGSFGLPVYGIGYDRSDNGIFGLDDATVFASDGFAVVGPPDADGIAALVTDVGDDYEEGWFNAGFWAHYTADTSPYDGDMWADGFGVSTRDLFDGSWDGLSFARNFVFTEPRQPSTSGSAVVPEPTSLAGMLICAAVALAGYRLTRRSRRPVV